MSSRDFVYLIANLVVDVPPKTLAWDKGGKSVVVGWAKMLRKQRGIRE